MKVQNAKRKMTNTKSVNSIYFIYFYTVYFVIFSFLLLLQLKGIPLKKLFMQKWKFYHNLFPNVCFSNPYNIDSSMRHKRRNSEKYLLPINNNKWLLAEKKRKKRRNLHTHTHMAHITELCIIIWFRSKSQFLTKQDINFSKITT